MKKMFSTRGSSFQMLDLSQATVVVSGIQYNLSVEGLVDGRIAIFIDAIEVGPSIVDEPTRLMILSEISEILDDNEQPFEFV